jgi:hypothetical protein
VVPEGGLRRWDFQELDLTQIELGKLLGQIATLDGFDPEHVQIFRRTLEAAAKTGLDLRKR